MNDDVVLWYKIQLEYKLLHVLLCPSNIEARLPNPGMPTFLL